LKTYADASFDVCLTDPPYGLEFMGKGWDVDVPGVEYWREVYRVLKPGAFVFAFGGTRTFHHLALAIEQSGFEIRDTVCWLYGSGFPKSLNLGKAFDKAQGNEREDLGEYDPRSIIDGANRQERPIGGQQVAPSETSKLRLTRGSSEWEGYGTALKPAWEPVIVAMKPLDGTYVENALKHGVAGLNIDASRIPFANSAEEESKVKNQHADFGTAPLTNNAVYGDYSMVAPKNYNPPGRYPANVVLSHAHNCASLQSELDVVAVWDCAPDCPVRLLNEQSGATGSFYNGDRKTASPTNAVTNFGRGSAPLGYGDVGGASRFFYTAKASRDEREQGLSGLSAKRKAGAEFRPNHSEKAEHGERGNPYGRWDAIKNYHPTVKPVELMRWLVKLTGTPKGGRVLDPFAGSGTTAVACKLEHRDCVAIELDPEYALIARERVKNWEVNSDIADFFKSPTNQ